MLPTRSMMIAARMSTPTIACCQNLSTRSAVSALVIVVRRRAPIAAPTTEPLPPKIATPPTTAAATTSSSRPVSVVAPTELKRDA